MLVAWRTFLSLIPRLSQMMEQRERVGNMLFHAVETCRVGATAASPLTDFTSRGPRAADSPPSKSSGLIGGREAEWDAI